MGGASHQTSRSRKSADAGLDSHFRGNERNISIGAPARRRLAGFARTLRDNGFRIGIAETRDALSVLASPAGRRATSLKPALRSLFCATHSDWEHFDKIFDAYWQSRHMRRRQVLLGAPGTSQAARKLAE